LRAFKAFQGIVYNGLWKLPAFATGCILLKLQWKWGLALPVNHSDDHNQINTITWNPLKEQLFYIFQLK
jgi:hypothetical protein